MRLLLNPNAPWGGGYQITPQGQPQGQPGQYGPGPQGQSAPAYVNPVVQGQGVAYQPTYGQQSVPYQQPQQGYQYQPGDSNQGQFAAAQAYQSNPNQYQQGQPLGAYQNPIQQGYQVQGQQGQSQGQPGQPFQFGPAPIPQNQPQSGVFATLPTQNPPANQPASPSMFPPSIDPNRQPQSLQEAQELLSGLRIQQIQALGKAGQTEQAMAAMQQHYQAQLQSVSSQLAQRDQALASATQDRLLSDSLAGITFRDQASALNCRQLIANRIEVGPDGQVRERGTGLPGPQAIQNYLRGDLAVFLSPQTQGGPGVPQGQFPSSQNPNQGPLSVGEMAMQRWEQGRRDGLAQGQFLPGWQSVVGQPQTPNPYAAFNGR